MIEYRKGDLLDVEEGIIVHGCNAQGVMGSGVALAVKQKYPDVYKKYRYYYYENELKLGTTQFNRINTNLWVVNAITQEFFGKDGKRYVNYAAICESMLEVFDYARCLDLCVHFPKIGAGLGGGDWNIIEQLINDCDHDNNVKKICWEL